MESRTRSSNNKKLRAEINGRKRRSVTAAVMGASLGAYLLGFAVHSSFQSIYLTLLAVGVGGGIGVLAMLKAYLDKP